MMIELKQYETIPERRAQFSYKGHTALGDGRVVQMETYGTLSGVSIRVARVNPLEASDILSIVRGSEGLLEPELSAVIKEFWAQVDAESSKLSV
jgi:hypothetical protein